MSNKLLTVHGLKTYRCVCVLLAKYAESVSCDGDSYGEWQADGTLAMKEFHYSYTVEVETKRIPSQGVLEMECSARGFDLNDYYLADWWEAKERNTTWEF